MKNLFTAKQFLILSLLGISLFSCSKDDADSPTKPNKVEKKLSKIEIDANNYSVFKYNKGLLAELEDLTDGEFERSTIKYNNDKKPIEVLNAQGKIKFGYTDERLVKEELYNTGSDIIGTYNQYTYQGKQVNEVTGYGLYEQDEPYFKRKYFYYPNGDVEKVEIYVPNGNNGFKLSIKIAYEYDNKINPFVGSVGSYLALFTQIYTQHNVIKETTTNAAGTLSNVITTTYTYDNDGYPLTATEKEIENDGDPVTTRMKFVYLP